MSRIVTFLLFGLIPFIASSQTQQNNHWIFGQQTGLFFTEEGPVEVDSSIDTGSNSTSSSVSTFDGDLLLYADQSAVYAADGSVLPDGNYGTSCDENLLIPNPGNTDQFYHIRTGFSGGVLSYSLIDLTLGEVGNIVDGEKDIEFFNIGGHIQASYKPDGSGYWLLSVDNMNGDETCYVRVFDISENGIELWSEFTTSWIWIGFYPEMDDVVLSPDCSKLALSFKGHYIALLNFDHEAGEITEALPQSIDNGSSFVNNSTELAFSPNSQYLYCIANQLSSLIQYDVSTFDANAINSSSQEVASNPSLGWTDLKLGPDGSMYVFNTSNNSLDRILNPDAPGSEIEFESEAVMLNGAAGDLFPETTNFLCGPLLPFFIPAALDVCLGDETNFSLSYNFTPDSLQWNFGDPEGGEANISESEDPVYVYDEPGEYTVNLDVWLDDELYEYEVLTVVDAYPEVELGNDQVICEGEEVVLTAGEAESYTWNTGEVTQSISPETSGLYSVVAANGNCAISDDVEITVIPALAVDLGPDQNPCPDETVTLDAGQIVNWSTGDESSFIDVTDNGLYIAVVQNECFTASDSVSVNYVQMPEVNLPAEQVACRGDSISLAIGIETDEIIWSSSADIYTEDSIYVSTSDLYTVSYVFQGCPAERDTELEFLDGVDLSQIQMPNIFSPNGDLSNNTYRPIFIGNSDVNPCNSSLFEANLRIYNRWGGLITEGGCSWTGVTENGQDCSEGVYYYMIDMSSNCPGKVSEKELTGTITLAR